MGAGGRGRKQIGRGWLSAPILEQHTIELERVEILLLIANVVVLFVSTSAARLPHGRGAWPVARRVGGQGDKQYYKQVTASTARKSLEYRSRIILIQAHKHI